MADACEIFGDIVPNIYIDQVFLEESLVDADPDPDVSDIIQTPAITVNLKVLDQLSDQGTYELLDDALEYQGVNFKEFVKVHCVLFTSEEDAESFITDFEDENYTNTSDYFNYPRDDQGNSMRTYTYDTIKTLQDFSSTYINQDGITEIISSFSFSLGANSVLDYLRVFCWIELDTQSLETQFGVGLPNEYKTVLSRYQDELVINKSILTSELTIFTTEDGDLWDGAIHVRQRGGDVLARTYMEGRTHIDTPHNVLVKTSTPISNVQDFRIRDEIEVLVADFENIVENQYLFPEQKQILDQMITKNSYFSEMFVTKDVDRNTRFFFAFDYGKYVLQSSKYANLISKMSDDVKQQIIDRAKIVKFMIKRRQVKENPARNRLGSPVQNFTLSDGTIEAPVILSLDDSSLNEIGLILTQQTTVPDSLLRYFTGIDKSMSAESDGFFQYFVELEVQDGFIPIMKEVYSKLSTAASNYEQYVTLTQIPGVYDAIARKFTAQAVAPQSMSGQDILFKFINDNLETLTGEDSITQVAVSEYLDALSYFVDLSGPSGAGATLSKKEYFTDNINTMLSPDTGGVDGVIMFQHLLNLLLSQVAQIFRAGHSGGGVEDTVANQPSNASSLFQLQTSEAQEHFDNTIGARFLNESYVDNVSNVRVSSFAGLSIYTQSQLGNSVQFEQNFNINAPINQTTEEALGNFGITYDIQPIVPATVLTEITKSAASGFIGQGQGAVASAANASYNVLSKADLSDTKISINTDAAFAPLANQLSFTPLANQLSLPKFDLASQDPNTSLSAISPGSQQGMGGLTDLNNLRSVASQFVQEQELTPDQLQTEVDVLVGFVAPSGFRGITRTFTPSFANQGTSSPIPSPPGFSLMIREAKFETKTLAALTTTFSTSAYYLCKQTRRSDVEVVDSYFLVTPATVTPATSNTVASQNTEILRITQEEAPAVLRATQGPAALLRTTGTKSGGGYS